MAQELREVYVVFRNADMTEGRGPMILASVFGTWDSAARYIDSLPGVMGRTARWSRESYGDWEIRKYIIRE